MIIKNSSQTAIQDYNEDLTNTFLDPLSTWYVLLDIFAFYFQVFRTRTPAEAIQLTSKLLEYTPGSRFSPLEACAHTFFDELRDPNLRLPNGRDLPQLFNFCAQG